MTSRNPLNSSDRRQFGCFILFLLPFCAVGVFMGIRTILELLKGSTDWEQIILSTVFALLFGGVGFGLMVVAFKAKKDHEREEELKKRHPDEPWLWRKDWAEGKIRSSSRKEMAMAWALTAFVLFISVPLVPAVIDEAGKGGKAALVGLVFPLIGLGLLTWAIRATIRWKRFGTSVVQMASVPGVIGGPVAGTIQTGLRSLPEKGFKVTLRSIRSVTRGSGKNRSTHEKILWQEEQRLGREELFPGFLGTAARFSFIVPMDCEQTDESDSDDRKYWTLQVQAALPGVDYDATFELPVFVTEHSSATVVTAPERVKEVSAAELRELRRSSKVRVRRSPAGGKEIVFPAARNPGLAASLTVFLLIWVGAIWLMHRYEAPLIFPVVFGLFGLLILYGVLSLWLEISRLVVEGGEACVKGGILGSGPTQRLEVEAIKSVESKITMQHGSGSGTPYYEIRLIPRSGRPVVVGRYIKNKRELDWLLGEIREAVGASA
jgi:hypothetical protein